jgi:carnitine O-acetyltransferase
MVYIYGNPARHSPDAYIQMVMQLAWFRQVGTVVSTYETGLTRLFKHGRTETIRTLSNESYAWVKAMDTEEDASVAYHLDCS